MWASSVYGNRMRCGVGSPSSSTNAVPDWDIGIRSHSAPRSRAPSPRTMSTSASSDRRSPMRVGNRLRKGSTSLRGSCKAASTCTQTARRLDSVLQPAVGYIGGQRGEFVNDDENERLVDGGDVLAGLAAQPVGALLRHGQCLFEHVGHGFKVFAGEAGEQRLPAAEFHAALGVEPPYLYQAGRDAGGDGADDGPDGRALAGVGGADHEYLRAEQPQAVGFAVFALGDGQRGEVRYHRHRGRRERPGQRVAALEQQHDGADLRTWDRLDGQDSERVGQALADFGEVVGDLAG